MTGSTNVASQEQAAARPSSRNIVWTVLRAAGSVAALVAIYYGASPAVSVLRKSPGARRRRRQQVRPQGGRPGLALYGSGMCLDGWARG
jgi:hypothetical protein